MESYPFACAVLSSLGLLCLAYFLFFSSFSCLPLDDDPPAPPPSSTPNRTSCQEVPLVTPSDVVVAHEVEEATPIAGQNERLYTVEGYDFLAADWLPPEGLAPLTQEVQRYIWKHQHPSEEGCATARYILHSSDAGLGSQMHVAGASLAHALERGVIWDWAPRAGYSYSLASMCGEAGNWRCFFQPPTNCSTARHANGRNTQRDDQSSHNVPSAFVQRLRREAPHMTTAEVKYWWRAQSVAYLMRFNERTVEALAILRKAQGMVRIGSSRAPPDVSELLLSQGQPLFPLPSGTVSLHVRHGDKWKEMTLQPLSKYLEAAENLVKMEPLFLRRTMFVSTEDPDVVREANTTQGWVALYSDIPRDNSNGITQMPLASDMTHKHFVQLLMALECDAWVGTRASNWNRLIDELRCVWVAKCAHPYVEVGEERDWKDYNW